MTLCHKWHGQHWTAIKTIVARYTADAYQKKINRLVKRSPASARKGLKKGIDKIVKEAKNRHLVPPRMPVGVGSETEPRIASRGRIRSMVCGKGRIDRASGKVIAEVRSRNGLSKLLHDGGVLMAKNPAKPFIFQLPNANVTDPWIVTNRIEFPRRPFLSAPVKRNRKNVLQYIRQSWGMEARK